MHMNESRNIKFSLGALNAAAGWDVWMHDEPFLLHKWWYDDDDDRRVYLYIQIAIAIASQILYIFMVGVGVGEGWKNRMHEPPLFLITQKSKKVHITWGVVWL